MIEVKVNVVGLDKLLVKTGQFHELLQRGPGVSVMTKLGTAAVEDVEDRFRSRGYGTWQPLSPATVARKGHDTIMVDTRTMVNSVGINVLTNDRVTVTVPYGGADKRTDIPIRHQLGQGNVPQRKIVEVTPQLLGRLTPVIKEWVSSWRT